VQFAETRRNGLDVDIRYEIGLLLGSVHDLPVLRVMPPYPERECGHKQHEHAELEQPAPGSAPPLGRCWRRFGGIVIGCR